MKPVPFNFEGKPVRVVLMDDVPWFVAIDVCATLGIANHRDALKRLDDDERRTVGSADTSVPASRTNPALVSESGVYNLIFQSRKPDAKRFRRWVTGEVLPSLRKTGTYTVSQEKLAPGAVERPLEAPKLLATVRLSQFKTLRQVAAATGLHPSCILKSEQGNHLVRGTTLDLILVAGYGLERGSERYDQVLSAWTRDRRVWVKKKPVPRLRMAPAVQERPLLPFPRYVLPEFTDEMIREFIPGNQPDAYSKGRELAELEPMVMRRLEIDHATAKLLINEAKGHRRILVVGETVYRGR